MPVSRVDGREDGKPVVHDEAMRRARLSVCSMSTDITDARILLDMLGLVEDTVRFPSWVTPVRGPARAPAQGPASPLPPAAYGAVPA